MFAESQNLEWTDFKALFDHFNVDLKKWSKTQK